MAYFSVKLKDINVELSRNIVTGFEIVLLNCDTDIFVDSEVIGFFCEDGFLSLLHTFLRISQETLTIFKIWLFYM